MQLLKEQCSGGSRCTLYLSLEIIKIMQLAIIITFDYQFELPPSPLKKNRFYTLKLKTIGISLVELHKSGHRYTNLRIARLPLPSTLQLGDS